MKTASQSLPASPFHTKNNHRQPKAAWALLCCGENRAGSLFLRRHLCGVHKARGNLHCLRAFGSWTTTSMGGGRSGRRPMTLTPKRSSAIERLAGETSPGLLFCCVCVAFFAFLDFSRVRCFLAFSRVRCFFCFFAFSRVRSHVESRWRLSKVTLLRSFSSWVGGDKSTKQQSTAHLRRESRLSTEAVESRFKHIGQISLTFPSLDTSATDQGSGSSQTKSSEGEGEEESVPEFNNPPVRTRNGTPPLFGALSRSKTDDDWETTKGSIQLNTSIADCSDSASRGSAPACLYQGVEMSRASAIQPFLGPPTGWTEWCCCFNTAL